ncbi:hypothetical protein ABT158_29410 [Nonomuraea sp. NPDC001636]|uniref:hypothetical protein n=1 Tax=Nonomuraea sp. NPDC001636 TaxID=3154391 RepID=UPI0033170C82
MTYGSPERLTSRAPRRGRGRWPRRGRPCAIGIKIAFAGRWRGALRWWPLVAESWAVVTVPAYIVFGESISNWIGGFHLIVGYATLGALLALRPSLTS